MNKTRESSSPVAEKVTEKARNGKTQPIQPTLPTREEIALRAYQIYLERNVAGAPGDELNDWIAAERELIEQSGKTRRKTAAA